MSDQAELKKFLATLSKTHETVISRIKDMERPTIEFLPSGSFTIDHATGGGYPRGRIIEIFGQPSGGKTTVSLLAIAETQKNGGTCAFIDAEHGLDLDWAAKLGVDVPNLIFNQPDKGGEQALNLVEELAGSGLVDMIVVDSVAALTPLSEIEGEVGDQQMAAMARMVGQGLRKLVPVVGKSKSSLIFINQVRDGLNPYGEKEVTPGGKALKFFSSIRLSVKKLSGSDIKDGERIIGHRIEISVKKNKVAPPFQKAELTLNFLSGIDRIDELCTLGIISERIHQAGPSYKFGDITAKGYDNLVNLVRSDQKLQDDIWKAIKEKNNGEK
jgi:recombination protein RecA